MKNSILLTKLHGQVKVWMTWKNNVISFKFLSVDLEPRVLTQLFITHDLYIVLGYTESTNCQK